MESEIVEIVLDCPYCDEKFTTTMWTFDGMPFEFCCGEDCYKDYYSIMKVRERKLNEILSKNES